MVAAAERSCFCLPLKARKVARKLPLGQKELPLLATEEGHVERYEPGLEEVPAEAELRQRRAHDWLAGL